MTRRSGQPGSDDYRIRSHSVMVTVFLVATSGQIRMAANIPWRPPTARHA